MTTKKTEWMPKKGAAAYVEPVTHKSFRPYATAIGEAALAWNVLHDELASLFWMLLGGDKGREAAALWHVIENDRLQRRMLERLAEATLLKVGLADVIQKKKLADIKWLLVEVDKLSDARNNILHAPLWSRTDVVDPEANIVAPLTHHGNPRAIKLAQRDDLLSEIRWFRDVAMTLYEYCSSLKFRTAYGADPWPEKPPLPNREHQTLDLARAHAKRAKQRPRPPQSSRT